MTPTCMVRLGLLLLWLRKFSLALSVLSHHLSACPSAY